MVLSYNSCEFNRKAYNKSIQHDKTNILKITSKKYTSSIAIVESWWYIYIIKLLNESKL